MSIAAYQGVCPTCRYDHSADILAPTTRETADHIGEANEKVDHIGEATTMIDHAELAACPFCGSDRVRIVRVQVAVDAVECGECGSSTRGFPRGRWNDPDEAGRQAIASWNRRPCEAVLLSEIAALRGERDANWQEYLEERSARMDAGTREYGLGERLTQAERQRDELRKALEPFAREAESWPELSDTDTLAMSAPDGTASAYDITMGEVRRASTIIADQGADQ